jgi:hypothetical protein
LGCETEAAAKRCQLKIRFKSRWGPSHFFDAFFDFFCDVFLPTTTRVATRPCVARRAFARAPAQHGGQAHSCSSFLASRSERIAPPALPRQPALLWYERLQNEHSSNVAASSLSSASPKLHCWHSELDFAKRNKSGRGELRVNRFNPRLLLGAVDVAGVPTNSKISGITIASNALLTAPRVRHRGPRRD